MYTYREGGDLWSVVLWLQERVQDIVLNVMSCSMAVRDMLLATLKFSVVLIVVGCS